MPVQERYFPIVCTEDHRQRAQKINIACLMPWEASPRPGTYVIDPQFPGTTGDRWKDYAFCSLIFDAQPVAGEVWREMLGEDRAALATQLSAASFDRAWRVRKGA